MEASIQGRFEVKLNMEMEFASSQMVLDMRVNGRKILLMESEN